MQKIGRSGALWKVKRMSKKRSGDAYGKLVRVLIVLFVLTVICFAGYKLLDQSIKMQEADNAAIAQQENDRLLEQ